METNSKCAKNNRMSGSKSVGQFLGQYGIYIVLVLIIAGLGLASNRFLTGQNIINVIRQISINGILAIGVTFIIITGGIDLSIGSVLAFSGVVATSFAHPDPSYPMIFIIMAGILVGLICGLLNGLLVAFSSVPPFIVTLGMMTVARGLALVYTDGRPVIDLSSTFKVMGQGEFLGIPIPIYIFALIILIGIVILHKLRLGRYVYSVGGNEKAAKASGINIAGVKLFVYTFAGALYGLTGVLLASRTNAGTPAAGVGYELDAIAAAVLGGTSTSGGRGTIFGSIAGVLIMGIIGNGLDILNVSSYIQQIIKGIIIVGAVFLDQVNKK